MSGLALEKFKDGQNPKSSIENLKVVVGHEFYDESLGREHVNRSGGKLHFAVNSYMREFMVRESIGKERKQEVLSSSSERSMELVDVKVGDIGEEVWELVFEWLDAETLLSIHSSCKCGIHRWCHDKERLWIGLMENEGYMTSISTPSTESLNEVMFRGRRLVEDRSDKNRCISVIDDEIDSFWGKLSFREKYLKCRDWENHRYCFHCKSSRVIPLIFGFPSAKLLALSNSKNGLKFGGDHLLKGSASWICSNSSCLTEYYSYPFRITRLEIIKCVL